MYYFFILFYLCLIINIYFRFSLPFSIPLLKWSWSEGKDRRRGAPSERLSSSRVSSVLRQSMPSPDVDSDSVSTQHHCRKGFSSSFAFLGSPPFLLGFRYCLFFFLFQFCFFRRIYLRVRLIWGVYVCFFFAKCSLLSFFYLLWVGFLSASHRFSGNEFSRKRTNSFKMAMETKSKLNSTVKLNQVLLFFLSLNLYILGFS